MSPEKQKLKHSVTQSFSSRTLPRLKELIALDSISCAGFSAQNVRACAERVAQHMRECRADRVRLLEGPESSHPAVLGEWGNHLPPSTPTVLLYAHYDVQPVGDRSRWKTDPFTPTEAEGPGGLRLYARGSADDKAGVWVHLAALSAHLECFGSVPLKIRLFVEGEEEIGSVHLPQFLEQYRSDLAADAMILTDTSNVDCGIPGLTLCLRGMIELQIEVRGLQGAIHSGMWGGPVPDPAMALCKVLAQCVDSRGQIAIPGVFLGVPPLSASEKHLQSEVSTEETEFRKQCGLLPGVEVLSHPRFPSLSPATQVWRLPSMTVNAISVSSRSEAPNSIAASAWAKVTLRTVDGMDPQRVASEVVRFLKAQLPWGLHLSVQVPAATSGWRTPGEGPAFQAAQEALTEGYGAPVQLIGCGGTIPFVRPLVEAMGGIPALLLGVEDPYTNAHGENESVLLSDLHKACVSQAFLLHSLATCLGQTSGASV